MNNMALNQHTKLLLTVLLTATMVSTTTVVAGEGKPTKVGWPWQRTEVLIKNTLDKHENLQVHCKDKEEDYGVHQVPYGQTYKLVLDPFWGSDYYCGFVFNNALHWFDIYTWKRDKDGCDLRCRWDIYEAGPCLLNPHGCYQWNRDGTLS